MHLTACTCNAASYRRIRRAWWMRLVWTRRLYHCYACDRVLLIPAIPHRRFDDSGGLDGDFVPTAVLKGR